MKSVFLLFIMTLSFAGHAQVDTLDYSEEEDSIVIINKDPVIIKRNIYLKSEETTKRIKKGIAVYAIPLSYFSYYNACAECMSYLSLVKSTTHPAFSYSLGADFHLQKKNIFLETGLSYTNFREKFNYTFSDTTYKSINQFGYLNLKLNSGYALNIGKMKLLVSGGIIRGSLLNWKGTGISKSDSSLVGNLKSVRSYRNVVYSLSAEVKVIYKVSDYLSGFAGPYYQGDICSVTERKENIVQQRNSIGVKMGLIAWF
ncbi:MAG: hypothetical protein ACJ75J_06230 [Cytophagaceae bacterium]